MIVIGLTGSIGMGKTTVADLCRRLGVPVDNADEAVHDFLAPKGAAFSRVKRLFPEAVVDGEINRAVLGSIVFADAKKLVKLEKILHPLVAAKRKKFLARCRRQKQMIVVLDIPLLFEKNLDGIVDVVITVSAPLSVQRARVLARPGMTSARYRAILARQMPDKEKRRRSDYVIDTGGSKAATLKQLRAILKEIDSGNAPNRP